MSASKCGACGCAVGDDAKTCCYVAAPGGVVENIIDYPICESCFRRTLSHPEKVVRALRRTYQAGLN